MSGNDKHIDLDLEAIKKREEIKSVVRMKAYNSFTEFKRIIDGGDVTQLFEAMVDFGVSCFQNEKVEAASVVENNDEFIKMLQKLDTRLDLAADRADKLVGQFFGKLNNIIKNEGNLHSNVDGLREMMTAYLDRPSPSAVIQEVGSRLVANGNDISRRIADIERFISGVSETLYANLRLQQVVDQEPVPTRTYVKTGLHEGSNDIKMSDAAANVLVGDDHVAVKVASQLNLLDDEVRGGKVVSKTTPYKYAGTDQDIKKILKAVHDLCESKGSPVTGSQVKEKLIKDGFDFTTRSSGYLRNTLSNCCVRFGVEAWWPLTLEMASNFDYVQVKLPRNKRDEAHARDKIIHLNKVREARKDRLIEITKRA